MFIANSLETDVVASVGPINANESRKSKKAIVAEPHHFDSPKNALSKTIKLTPIRSSSRLSR